MNILGELVDEVKEESVKMSDVKSSKSS